MITDLINNLPTNVQQRVLMAMIAATNSRIFSFAKFELAALRRLGLRPPQPGVDAANEYKRVLQLREQELDPDNETTQAMDNGLEPPRNWRAEAEPFVLLKELFTTMYADFCNEHRIRVNNPSLANHAEFMRTRAFVPNIAAAQDRVDASGGKFSLDTALRIQEVEWRAQQEEAVKNTPMILAIAENFYAMALFEGEPRTLDHVFEILSIDIRLSLVNVLWRKLDSFFDESPNSRGFLSSRYPIRDISGDISLTTIAIADTLELAESLLAEYDTAYGSDPDAPGLPQLAVIDAIDRAKKAAAKAKLSGAEPTKPTTPANNVGERRLVKATENVVMTSSNVGAMADAFRAAVAR